MRNFALLILITLYSCVVTAQNTETRDVSDFNKIQSGESIRVILKKGSTPRVEITTDGDLEDVITEVKGGELEIERDDNIMFGNSDDIEVVVYYQELNRISASSSSRLSSEELIESKDLELKVSSSARMNLNVEAEDVEIAVSSSGRLEVNLTADEVEAAASSSGRISLTGNAKSFEAKSSSSGRISADSFTCKVADLTASSSGRITLNVEEEIEAKASSSGRISYGGQPKIKSTETSSGGRVSSLD